MGNNGFTPSSSGVPVGALMELFLKELHYRVWIFVFSLILYCLKFSLQALISKLSQKVHQLIVEYWYACSIVISLTISLATFLALNAQLLMDCIPRLVKTWAVWPMNDNECGLLSPHR